MIEGLVAFHANYGTRKFHARSSLAIPGSPALCGVRVRRDGAGVPGEDFEALTPEEQCSKCVAELEASR